LKITKSLIHWIDEALMCLFFFTVGLEIKREILVGELATIKKVLLPVAAALGGMLVPAAIYMAFNYNTPCAKGWGIPMATDIAFSLAALAILGSRIPFGIKIFLSAFAIADDLGAVLVLALFYAQSIAWECLLIATLFLAALALANYLWIRWTSVYAILGVGMWFCILCSGVHATIAGVLVALFIPAKGKYDTHTLIEKIRASIDTIECSDGCGYTILLNKDHQNAVHNIELACHEIETPLQRLGYGLQPWVTFLVLPLFALGNSGIVFHDINLSQDLTHPITLGIVLGLVLGKPLGISLFTFLAVKILKTPLMTGIYWHHIIGAGILGGIGFTMSLFISGLSFSIPEYANLSRLGILMASIISGTLGVVVLGYWARRKN
ncbi:MAG: Na+/H+ antiporter NhaA, partial [Deltaproteobacteria bacterium]|nr:Na+/H+ antiporter NhaA [Deltaproteobacteria bacterium]